MLPWTQPMFVLGQACQSVVFESLANHIQLTSHDQLPASIDNEHVWEEEDHDQRRTTPTENTWLPLTEHAANY
jgi:hypothetical protein